MEQLKNILAQVKTHYEKVLLGVVLLALFCAVGWLFLKLNDEQTKLKALQEIRAQRKGKEAKPLDLARHEAALQLALNPPPLDFSRPHNVLNPVKWQQRSDGSLLKIQTGKEQGVDALVVTNIVPLLYMLTYERAAASGYYVGEINEAHMNPQKRNKAQAFLTLNSPSPGRNFVLKEVRGAPDDPSELILELTDLGKQTVSISKDAPYVRTNGYKADLSYPPLNKVFRDMRIDSKITLENEEYKIVGITFSNVVVSAKPNDKRTTISYNRVP
jgi:hypothetical protein